MGFVQPPWTPEEAPDPPEEHENPDPRIEGYMRMVLSEGFGITLNPKAIEMGSDKGTLVIFTGDDGFIHMVYKGLYSEQEVRLFEGCRVEEEHVENKVVEAVATERYVLIEE